MVQTGTPGFNRKLRRLANSHLQPMHERHEHEQYFFDQGTLDHLAAFASDWKSPCGLCAPMLGKRLAEEGVPVTILDIDSRFAGIPGYRRFDVYRPEWLGQEFDLIICDPPFFNVSLSQLFDAIRTLACNKFTQSILISFLSRRAPAIAGTFAPFEIRATGYFPSCQTVQKTEKNSIEFFGNLSIDQTRRLIAGQDPNTDTGKEQQQ